MERLFQNLGSCAASRIASIALALALSQGLSTDPVPGGGE